jgi:hypothetical protein
MAIYVIPMQPKLNGTVEQAPNRWESGRSTLRRQ